MKGPPKTALLTYRLLITFAGALLLLAITLLTPPDPNKAWLALLITPSIAFQIIFTQESSLDDFNLSHVIVLGSGLLYGPSLVGWSTILGVGSGYALRRHFRFAQHKFLPSRQFHLRPLFPFQQLEATAVAGRNIIPLVLTLSISRLQTGIAGDLPTYGAAPLTNSGQVWWTVIIPSLLFGLLHMGLYLGDYLFRQENSSKELRRVLTMVSLMEFLPLPFILLMLMSYPAIQIGALISLGALPAIFTFLFHRTTALHSDLERRVNYLSTLNRVSQALRSSLDLENIINAIHLQVTQLLGVDNFYVALFDPGDQHIWYPLAVKYGERRSWPRRPLEDRLTDRVICQGEPILLARHAREELAHIGLPPSEDAPYSWMGVPLISSERTIGCLAVFSISPEVEFTPSDLELLIILSGQASVAIENGLLYARTDTALARRVQQLSILESVGRELAAAIQSERLFDRILAYALEFTNSNWGHISLYNPKNETLEVKASHGYNLTKSFFTIQEGVSGKAVRTREAINLGDVSIDPDYLDLTAGAARSLLTVLLTHENQVLGALTVESDKQNAYANNDQVFLSQLANQAAIAAVNAELYNETLHVRDRLAAVLNSVEEGILLVEGSGRITLANESIRAITGLSVSDFIEKKLVDLPGEVLQTIGLTTKEAEILINRLGRGQAWVSPKSSFTANAAKPERRLERFTTPLWAETGQAIGLVLVLRDVTEEYQINQARELITETVVHDLRAPISAVIGALDVIEDEHALSLSKGIQEQDELIVQALHVARRGAQRVLGLVESLLDIARFESGKIDITLNKVDLHTLVSNTLAEFMPQGHEFGILLRNEVPRNLPSARADQGKIARVLSNLVDNALKFTPSGGQVIVTAELIDDDRISIQVSDTGPGIPLEYREKIFERFGQVPGQQGRRRGSGLGLTYCRLAVEAHGGLIWVDQRPGGGSSFVFTLPISN